MLAGHRTGSDPMFLHRKCLQILCINIQMLNEDLVTLCVLCGDGSHTRAATRKVGASVQRSVMMRRQMGSLQRPVVRNVQVVISM
jgi:hypothetical protein